MKQNFDIVGQRGGSGPKKGDVIYKEPPRLVGNSIVIFVWVLAIRLNLDILCLSIISSFGHRP